MKYFNNDEIEDDLDYDDSEFDLGLVKVKYYLYSGEDIYYSVLINKLIKTENKISFMYYGKAVTTRDLTEIESEAIFSNLRTLQIPFGFNDYFSPEVLVDPDVREELSIQSRSNKTSFKWNSVEEEEYPNKLLSILVFRDLIENLLTIDYSEFEMPVYK